MGGFVKQKENLDQAAARVLKNDWPGWCLYGTARSFGDP
jgi:hypothetical protein